MTHSLDSARDYGDARRYSIDAFQIEHALEELLDEHPFASTTQFGCYRLSGQSRFSDIARHVECEVFNEFFGNAAPVMGREYGDYEQASDFLLIVDRQSLQAVGALRTIHYSDAGFKTLNDIAWPPISISAEEVQERYVIDDWANCWDIATVAVAPEHRGDATGQLVSTSLYGYLYALALQSGIEHFIAILDDHAYRQLVKTFAIPFTPILDSLPFKYLGSDCSRATHVRLSNIRPNMEKYLRNLDENSRAALSPYFRKLLDSEKLPPLIVVSDHHYDT